jgi:hypothetical protein
VIRKEEQLGLVVFVIADAIRATMIKEGRGSYADGNVSSLTKSRVVKLVGAYDEDGILSAKPIP